jgi:DNA-binding CsgD family transcriptional regulator
MSESRLIEFSGIVDALYADGESTGTWRGFLQRLKAATGSMYACMAFGTCDAWGKRTWLFEGEGRGSDEQAARRTDYLDLSPFSRLPQDVVTTMGELLDTGQRMQPGFYSEVVQPHDIGDIIGTNFIRHGNQLAHFRLGRARVAGRYTHEHKELCQLILPHLHRSWERASRAVRNAAWKGVLSEALQMLGAGVVLINADRDILDASSTALETIDAHRALLSATNGRLRLHRQEDERQLEDALERIVGHPAAGAQSFGIDTSADSRRLHFVCRRMPDTVLFGTQPCMALFIRDDRPPRPVALQTLRALFGLTPAEARIACGLIGGLSMAQIAAHGGISRNTAYAYLKSAFGKLGVSQQSALVSHVLGSLASLGRE